MSSFAVDFDGTLTIDDGDRIPNGGGFRYPGSLNKRIIDFIREMYKAGHNIMIYSIRCNLPENDTRYVAMIQYLHDNDIPYDSVYEPHQGKPSVDYFIDDQNISLDEIYEDEIDKNIL